MLSRRYQSLNDLLMASFTVVFQLFAISKQILFIILIFQAKHSQVRLRNTFVFKFYIMKTIITFSLLIAVSLFSELTMAGGNFKINVALKPESNTLTEISKNTEQKYEVTISDLADEVLYHREAQGEQLESSKIFDFSKSAPGVYKMKVEFNGGSSEQLVTVTRAGVEVGELVRKTSPVFSYNDNLLTLAFLNQNKEGMSIHIYSEGTLVWDKELKDAAYLKKKFDLSKLDKGLYKISFTVGEDNYEYALTR